MADMSADLAVRERPSLRVWSRGFFATPPGWWFHLLCVPPAFMTLWSASYPGFQPNEFFADAALVLLAGWWLLRLIAHIALRGTGRLRFGVAPMCAVVLVALVAVDAPLRARWHFGEGDFTRVVASLQSGTGSDWQPVEVPQSIGRYRISPAYRVPGGLIFYEANGSLFDDAGFGWFPAGPDPKALNNGSFENPQFTHLHGPWYTWTASW